MRRIILPLLLLCGGAACDDGPAWSGDDAPPPADSAPDFGPVALYARHMFFLSPDGDTPTAAILDFAALADTTGVRGGVRARILDGGSWTAAADTGWSGGPMREPWRVVPQGPLRIVVDDDGEISALIFPDEPGARLETGALLAETRLDAGTQLVLRQADLRSGDRAVHGLLLDARLGRSARRSDRPARDTAPAPTPLARPGTEAFLANGAGFFVALTRGGDGGMAWLRGESGDELRRGVALTVTGWDESGEGGREPVAWAIQSEDGGLGGELRTETAQHNVLEGLADATALDYVLVSGWVEDGGVRRDVFGLVRHVR